jgi:transcriptional regulator with XRE-family HTH domain
MKVILTIGMEVIAVTRNARRLFAGRLRELRETAFQVKVTQDQLAAALGHGKPLSSAAISTWENGEIDKRPTESRLVQYALLFSTPQSLIPRPHVPAESKLDKPARIRFDVLRTELLRLRDNAEQEARREKADPENNDLWHHDRAEKLLVVVPELPSGEQTEYANPASPNYVRLARYGDLDAFFDMYTALTRAGYTNLSHRSAREPGIDIERNLVLIGGPAWNEVTATFMSLLDLPIRQTRQPNGQPDFFTTSEGSSAHPATLSDSGHVIEDVGLFVRATNPTNPDTDVTICSGVFTHGVLGAVHAFTNPQVAAGNIDAIRDRLGQTTSFAVLFGVKVIGGRVPTPRLANAIIDCVAID